MMNFNFLIHSFLIAKVTERNMKGTVNPENATEGIGIVVEQ